MNRLDEISRLNNNKINKKTKKLYHISLNFIESDNKPFIARVPHYISKHENESIKRICFSDSIEGCLNLVNWTENLLIKKLFFNSNTSCPIRVYEFEFDINDDNLLGPYEVSDYEYNAKLFGEYWYVGDDEIHPTTSYFIEIKDNFKVEEIKLGNGATKYYYKNIEYKVCEIVKPIIKDDYQIFDFNLNTCEINDDEEDLEDTSFMVKFKMLQMQPQLFEAIHLGEFNSKYTIKSEILGNDKIRIKVNSPFFVLSKNNISKQLGEYIVLDN